MGEYSSRVRSVVDDLFSLVEIPLYGVAGVLSRGRLLVSALLEGAYNVYAYTLGGELVRLNRDPVSGVAEPPYEADRIVVRRDVSRGRELDLLYLIGVDEPGVEEPLSPDLKPMRIMSVVDKGERVYVSGVTEMGVEIFEAQPRGGAESIGVIQGLAALLDVRGDTGVGLVFKPSGRSDLFIIDTASGRIVERDVGGSVFQARMSPRGTVVYAAETSEGLFLGESDPWSWEPRRLEMPYRDLEEYRPVAVNYLAYTPRGELLVVARREGRSRVFLDGRDLGAPPGTHSSAYRFGEGIVTTHTSLSTPPRIILWEPGSGWKPILEASLPESVRGALGESRFHWVRSWDGSRLPVFTLESGRAGRPGPTVVLVHGGPFSEDFDGWDPFAASLAVAGFNVVMVNYRGSTGYGEEWRLRIVGDPCGGELQDILAASDWAVGEGLASRLYIMGYSYGGYMTLCALVRAPGKYRAGVAGAAVVDWVEMYELSDPLFKSFIELMFGGVVDRGKWRERSPITYIDSLQEPLCIIHSENDSRTPLKPVLRLIDAASEKGKSVEAHIIPDLGHTINTVDDLVKLVLPAILFLLRQEARADSVGD